MQPGFKISVLSLNIDLHVFADSYAAHLRHSQVPHRITDCVALRIEHRCLWHHNHFCLHHRTIFAARTWTSAIPEKLRSFPICFLLKTTSSVPCQRARSWIEDDWRATNLRIQSPRNLNHCTDFISAGRGPPGSLTPSVLAHDVARLFIFAQAKKDWCTQFSVTRPLGELDLSDKLRIHPVHLFHHGRRDSLHPLAVLF